MKKIEFETSKGRFRVVDEKDYMVFHLMLTENGFDCISLKEITEEQASEIVDEFKYHTTLIKKVFIDYLNADFYFESAIESLHSLLKSKGIHLFENPYDVYDMSTWHDANESKQKAEEKTFYNPYIFKL